MSVSRAVAAAMLFFCSAPVVADGFTLGNWETTLELVADYTNVEVDRGQTRRSENESLRTEERLTLRNNGSYYFDRRLLDLSFGATFGLSQDSVTSSTSGMDFEDNRDADLSGYDFFAGILKGKNTLSANLFANRNRYIQTRELAGRTDIDIQQQGLTLISRSLYIPSTLSIRQELIDESTRAGPTTVRSDEQRDILTYQGRRGWLNSQLTLRYEQIEKTDEFFPLLDFESREGSVYSSIDFGPKLKLRWDSRLRSFSRDDFSEEDRLDIEQLLQVQHSPQLRTRYRYYYIDTSRPAGDTRTETASFGLHHRLYDSLTTDLQAEATDQNLVDGSRQFYVIRTNFGYTKLLPGEGRLTASLGYSHEEEDDDFDVAFVPQESHAFDATFALPVGLGNTNVVAASVQILKVAEGPSVAGCGTLPVPNMLVEGVDYSLQTIGNRTEIIPLPCTLTTPGINPGDTIAVDYEFTRGGMPVAFASDNYRVNVSVDYGWIRPFFVHQQTNQELTSGTGGDFLTDLQIDILGLELRRDRGRLQTSIRTEFEEYDSDDQIYDEFRANQTLRYAFRPGLTLTLNGRQSFREFSMPTNRKTDLLSLRSILSYSRGPNLYIDVLGNIRSIEDSIVPEEYIRELGVQVRWHYGRLEVYPSLKYIDIERGNVDSSEYRAFVRLRRRFF